MFLSLTPAQQRLRTELRDYFAELLPERVLAQIRAEERDGTQIRRVRAKLAADGWLGVAWPAEYGGRGLSAVEQCIFREEAERASAPIPFITLDTVGPALMNFGSEEQKARYLPKILSGATEFAIGYSEPEAGSDLAALRTRAYRDGDEYVVTGTKMWTTHAQVADYVWLAARTGTEADRHRGISIFIVPTDSPGFSFTPINVFVQDKTNVTYYDEVRVPAANLVLGENQGWKLITTQLNHERAGVAGFNGRNQRTLELVLAWATETKDNRGRRIIDQPWAQQALGRAHVLLRTVQMHNYRLAALAGADAMTAADASVVKVMASEAGLEATRLMMEVVGQASALAEGSAGAVLHGRLERNYRAGLLYTFGGGTNEVQREIVAWNALKMPRGKR